MAAAADATEKVVASSSEETVEKNPEASTDAEENVAAEQEQAEENDDVFDAPLVILDFGGRKVKTTLKIPQVRLQETVLNLKQLLRDVPELCHISNCCHLETVSASEVAEHVQHAKKASKSKKKSSNATSSTPSAARHPFQSTVRLDEDAILGECESLARGDYLLLLPDQYSATTAWEHVNHVRKTLRNPPGPLSGMSSEIVQVAAHDGQETLDEDAAMASAAKIPSSLPLPVPANLESFYPGQQQAADGVVSSDVIKMLTREMPICARELVPSGWNPPPSSRKLKGDLFYLRVTANDGKTYHVTACREGFFQNASSEAVFNPEVAKGSPLCPTLVELLSLVLSGFASQYKNLLAAAKKRNEDLIRDSGLSEHDVTAITTNANLPTFYAEANRSPLMPHPQGQWNEEVNTPHVYDRDRAFQSVYDPLNMTESPGNPRDWNEEYQGLLEMPVENLEQRICRARLLEALHNDFADNARRGAIALVEGQLVPLNPTEPAESHVFMFNNAFLSVAQMDHGYGLIANTEAGNAEGLNPIATYSGSNHDLQTIRNINHVLERKRLEAKDTAEEPGDRVHTLNTVLVDFQGFRVIAQSLVPGILQHDHVNTLLYGSVNLGRNIHAKEEMAEDVATLMKSLYVCGGKVRPTSEENAEDVTISAPVNSKGLRGADGRRYLLDITKSTPVDVNFYTEEQLEQGKVRENGYVAVLRPELVQHLVDKNRRGQEIIRRQKAEEIYASYEEKHGKQTEESQWSSEITDELEKEIIAARDEVPDAELPSLDVNLYSEYQPKELRDEKAVKDAKELAEFLLDTQVPGLVNSFRNGILTPADGAALVSTMHNFGINVRYLGKIADALAKVESTEMVQAGEDESTFVAIPAAPRALHELCEVEMVSRSLKWIFRRIMHEQASLKQSLATVIVRILNAVFGQLENSNESVAEDVTVEDWLNKDMSSSVGATVVRRTVRALVKEHFGYELRWWWSTSAEDQKESRASSKVLMRRMCQVCGIRMASRNYVLEAETPFFEADLVDTVPIVKTVRPEWCLQEVRDRIAGARNRLSLKNAPAQELQLAYQFAMEALTMVCQVEGPVHRNALACIMTISDILRIVRDVGGAITQHRRALALANVLGAQDSENIAAMHLALGNLYHIQQVYHRAVEHMRRAAYLYELMAGPRAQQLTAIYQRLATMYLEISQPKTAFACVQEAISRCGDDKHQLAILFRISAQSMAGMASWTQSLEYERSAYAILKALYGPEHPRTVDSAQTVKVLTLRCVEERRANQEMAEIAAQEEKKRLRSIKKKSKGKSNKKK